MAVTTVTIIFCHVAPPNPGRFVEITSSLGNFRRSQKFNRKAAARARRAKKAIGTKSARLDHATLLRFPQQARAWRAAAAAWSHSTASRSRRPCPLSGRDGLHRVLLVGVRPISKRSRKGSRKGSAVTMKTTCLTRKRKTKTKRTRVQMALDSLPRLDGTQTLYRAIRIAPWLLAPRQPRQPRWPRWPLASRSRASCKRWKLHTSWRCARNGKHSAM